jgi:hypothetical protein
MMVATIKSNEELLTFYKEKKTRSINVKFIVSQMCVCICSMKREKEETKREKKERQNCLHIASISIITLLPSPSLSPSYIL